MLLRSCFTGILFNSSFFGLIPTVKYKHSALYIEELANAGIYYQYQSVDDNNIYLSFSDLTQKYDFKNKNKLLF